MLLSVFRRHSATRILPLFAILIASLLCSQLPEHAAGCIGSDGTVPSWKGSGANPVMANRIKAAQAFARANKLSAPLLAPVSGTHKVLIILIENADQSASFTSSYRSASLWAARVRDFDNYYNEVSLGRLRMNPAAESHGTANDGVVGPIKASSLSGTSSVDWTNSPTYALQAIKAANAYVNFAAFDKNGDKVLTSDELHVCIYQAGNEESFGGSAPTPNAWAHMKYYSSGLPGSTPSSDSDGIRVTSYVYCGSKFSDGRMATMGQMTHELGHDLGLPDLYDTDSDPYKDWRGLGYHCLMASGSWGGDYGDKPVHIDGFFKKWLGWSGTIRDVSAPVNSSFSVRGAKGSNDMVQISVPGSDEFFVVENRQQTGFDEGLPGSNGGLAIYHCDHGVLQDLSGLSYLSGLANDINSDPTDFAIKVEEADGNNALGNVSSDKGADTDYFRSPAKTSFTATTTPNSKLKNGSASNVSISGISASGATMTFTVGSPPPVLRTFFINGGAASTSSRDVTLNSTFTGTAKYILASEYSNFSSASWVPYSAALPFRIKSTGNGTKTIYFKVKDGNNNASNWMSDSIELNELIPPPVLTSFKINNGASTTYGRNVTLNNTWTGGTPYRYLASEYPNFANAYWIAWSAAPTFTLSPGNGTKTIYFKIKTASNIGSNVMSDTIVLNEQPAPVVTSFKINAGATSCGSRTVALNNVCSGTPTQYMASENASFSGASWLTWSGAPAFTITSAQNGNKTIYFKVKNAYGTVSGTVSDTIRLDELISLSLNGSKVSGGIGASDYDLFKLTVPSTGWVTILSEPGTLIDGYMYLFNSSWTKVAEADDQGDNWMPMISKYLAAGTYYIQMQGNADSDIGTYTISAKTGSAYKSLSVDGGWTGANISYGSEVDWYQVNITSKGTYTIETTDGALKDAVMFLYRPGDLYWLAKNDDLVEYDYFSGWNYPSMPAISTTLDAGTYYVAVHAYSTITTGDYDIRVRRGNSDMTTMSPIANGPALNWSISSSRPDNFFVFSVLQSGTYTIATTAGSLSDAQMTLDRLAWSTDHYTQTRIASNSGVSSTNTMPKITATLTPGTYLIWVGGETVFNTGSYSLTLTK